jgi:hypothetical protein
LDATNTGVQNVNGGSAGGITRTYHDPSGNAHVGNEIWLEVYSTLGTNATTVNVNYTNENGVAHVGTCSIGGGTSGVARLAQSAQKVKLASGDRGVQAVTSIQLAGSTLTAGNFGVTIVHPIITLAIGTGSAEIWSSAIEGDLEVLAGSCLFWSFMTQGNLTASLPQLDAWLTFVDK